MLRFSAPKAVRVEGEGHLTEWNPLVYIWETRPLKSQSQMGDPGIVHLGAGVTKAKWVESKCSKVWASNRTFLPPSKFF